MFWLLVVSSGLFLLWRAVSRSQGARSLVWWALGIVSLLFIPLATRFGLRTPFLLAAPLLVWMVWRALAYVQRLSAQSGSGAPFDSTRTSQMTRKEALRVLGLEEGATADEVRAAHRKLIKKLHPDQGGSSVLTQQVNEAKKVLER